MKILLVEDDINLAKILTNFLEKHDYLIDIAADGELAWEMLDLLDYDLILLDVMLPKLDGIKLCRRLREHDRAIPVMLITARDSVVDKSMGLDSGADDYLVKPFDLQELLSRVRALFRRFADRPLATLALGDVRLETDKRALCRNGRIVPLTRKEYLLLELLFRHPRRIFSRSDIVDRLWSIDNTPTEDTVKSHIRRIRHKLAEIGATDLIETLYGHGYRIEPSFLESPTTKTAIAPSRIEEFNESLGDIWKGIRAGVFEQVAILEAMIDGGNWNALELESAQQAAHKLAGTVGSCGFEAASHIAKAIEVILQDIPSHRDNDRSLSLLVQVLRTQLEDLPVPSGR
jgi:DNA-binding response OmpR family regulator